MRLLILLLIAIIPFNTSGQKEDHIWLFGKSKTNILNVNGFSFGNTVVDFNTIPPRVNYDSLIILDFDATNASFSKKNGDLLAYSNGMAIYNSSHTGIPGADSIAYGEFWESFNLKDTPNLDENTLWGFGWGQGILLLPHPGKEQTCAAIYFFPDRIDGETRINKLLFTEVSFKNDIKGETVIKDKIIHAPGIETEEFNQSRLQACQHANGRDWWVVALSKFDSLVYTYLLDPDGLKLVNTLVNPSPMEDIYTLGQMYFSPQGNKFVMSEGIVNPNFDVFMKVTLFDFDRCDGTFTFLSKDIISALGFRGTVSFSPSGEYFYVSTYDTLFQYKSNTNDIKTSKQLVGVWDGYHFKYEGETTGSPTYISAMAHGPDGKIYSVPASTNRFLHTIEYPDEEGTDCQLVQRKVELSTANHISMPNFPHFRMGALDGSTCDTLGINNQAIAKFRYEQDTTDYLNVRFTDISYYNPEVWEWDFGDGTTFEGKKPYYHQYEQDGAYNVCLRVRNEYSNDVECEMLYLGVTATEAAGVNPEISLYPNPVEDHLLVTFHNYFPKSAKISFYSTTGELIKTSSLFFGWNTIHFPNAIPGLYLYQIMDGDTLIKSGKIVIK